HGGLLSLPGTRMKAWPTFPSMSVTVYVHRLGSGADGDHDVLAVDLHPGLRRSIVHGGLLSLPGTRMKAWPTFPSMSVTVYVHRLGSG
ncbi:hypothetical protein D9C01_13605, partial [Corynebacterium diphtheriae]